MTLGEKLISLRKQKGMSQEELAESLDISRQAVSKWEVGESLPDTKNIIQLGKIFEVSLDYLLNDDLAVNQPQAASATIQPQTQQTPRRFKLRVPTIVAGVLMLLGALGILIFNIAAIASPELQNVYAVGGAYQTYGGLRGFLFARGGTTLFMLCCLLIMAGIAVVFYDVFIRRSARIKLSKLSRIGSIIFFIGINIILFFCLYVYLNPVLVVSGNKLYDGLRGYLTFYTSYYALQIFFALCCCATVAGLGIVIFDLIKKKIKV